MTFRVTTPDTLRPLFKRLKSFSVVTTLIFAMMILVATLSPPYLGTALGISDKMLHFTAFATLVLPSSIFIARQLIWIVPFALAFGGAIELLQPLFGRNASWADFEANLMGVIAGVVVGLILRLLIKNHFATRSH